MDTISLGSIISTSPAVNSAASLAALAMNLIISADSFSAGLIDLAIKFAASFSGLFGALNAIDTSS